MATCNFCTMDDFNLMVMGDEDVCKIFLEKEEGEEYNEADVYIAWDCFDCCLNDEFGIQSYIDEINDSLKWYKVELKSGYYSGMQIYVYTDYEDINAKWYQDRSQFLWTDEDCELTFGLDREGTIKMIEAEKQKIREFLEQSKDFGFRELFCLGVFSNGEAIYKYAEELIKKH